VYTLFPVYLTTFTQLHVLHSTEWQENWKRRGRKLQWSVWRYSTVLYCTITWRVWGKQTEISCRRAVYSWHPKCDAVLTILH